MDSTRRDVRADPRDSSSTAVDRVHRGGPVLDLHLDTLLWHRLFGYDMRRRHRNRLPGSPLGFHSDLPRMVEGGVSGAYFGIHAWPFTGELAWREIVRQIEILHDYCARDTRLRHGTTAADFERGHAESTIVACMGVEGAHCINGRLERIELLYEAGVRYLTLAHFNRNQAATPAMGIGKNETEGLSGFGRELVDEMNRVGMIVDCAHLNEPCRLEAAERSRRPVWVTHTGVKGVHDHARNISDDSIRAVAASGGVIGLIFAPIFINGRRRGSVTDVIRHLQHIERLVGLEHVAVGTDFDGWIPSVPVETPDMSHLPAFTAALLEAGYDAGQIRGVLGGNVLASLRRYASSSQATDLDRQSSGDVPGGEAASSASDPQHVAGGNTRGIVVGS